ncbi:MAG: TonB-dependent receptor, partial [Rhizomicrobium sp.]
MTSNCNRLTIRTALLLSAAMMVAVPACATVLKGSISDGASHAMLPGASVHVEGTDITVNTDRSGTFMVPNLQAGQYHIRIEYVGYEPSVQSIYVGNSGVATVGVQLALESKIETVVITGERQAERIALQTKKVSDNFIDALSANDVGKLPDQNVAEALRRMPGISVANDQGEGRYVIIRGVSPELANVTVNGATAPAPEPDGRQVKLDDIPSSLISSLEVVKTLTADLDANAIAGAVNINTLSAFDRPDPFAYGRVSMGHYQLNDKTPYDGDLTLGRVFGDDNQYGLVLSGNYSRRDIESENFGSGGPDWNSYNGYGVPSTFQIRDYTLVRKRSGLVANFDWHVSDTTRLFLRSTYSTYSDQETRDRFTVTLPTSASSYSKQTADTGSFTGGTANRYVRFRTENDHTLNTSFGLDSLVGPGELTVEGGYAHAVKTDPNRNEYTFKASKITGSYDLSDFLYSVTPSAAAYTASGYAINKIVHTNREAVEDLYQLHADYLIPVSFLGDGEDSIKFGFKYTDRQKTNDQTSATLKPTSSTMTLANVTTSSGKATVYDGRYTFGPRVSYTAADAYVLAAHGTLGCDSSTAGGFKCDTATSISDSVSADYDISERIWAGYAMATLKFGGLTLIPGVRVEATDGTYKGKSYTASSTFDEGFDLVSK